MKKILLSGIALIAASHMGFTQNFLVDGYNCEYYSTGNLLYLVSTEPNSTLPTELTVPNKVTIGFSTYTVTDLGNGTNPVYSNGPAVQILTTQDNLMNINAYACANLDSLGEVVINGSPNVANNAFSNDPNLVSVTFTSGSGDIGDSAFEGCTKLRNVVLKDGVTKIGKRAFANCKSLRTLTIPKTVVTIAPDAFAGSGIKSVVLERGNAPLKFSKGIYVTVKQLPYPKR
jgi:hypothetical protein